MILNDHCQVCEFRQRCHDQAVQEDNISLLRGMGEKEIKSYARKGIFTVTQLSCTFRLRKKGKRVKRQQQPHYFALQAAAIRDKKIYVLKPPPLPASPVRIYLDIEGDSERSFAYLLGMIIDERGTETRHSLWADSKDDEQSNLSADAGDCKPVRGLHAHSLRELRNLLPQEDGESLGTKSWTETDCSLIHSTFCHLFILIFISHTLERSEVNRQVSGMHLDDPDASGLKSIVLRNRWERERDESLKQELVRYNLEDCLALKRVTELVLHDR